MVFAREINGQELTFGVSGKLIMNAVVLYDHQTDSLWSQFLAEAVKGPLAGTRLDLMASQLTTWEDWKEQHPNTLLLDRGGLNFGGGQYGGYFASNQAGILGESNPDDRLPRKELVLGLSHGERPRAYAYRDLEARPVLNDVYGGEPVVVTFNAASQGAPAAFSRVAEGQTLTFSEAAPGTMRDAETGSLWSTRTGKALDGPMEGQALRQLPAFASFWFAWSDFHPNTELFTPQGHDGEGGAA